MKGKSTKLRVYNVIIVKPTHEEATSSRNVISEES